MKKIFIFTEIMLISLVLRSQNDSMYIKKEVDDMNDKVHYLASKSMYFISDNKKTGFSLYPFIDKNLKVTDLNCVIKNIGSCQENDVLIIMFSDSTKITLTQWNDFNCEGTCYLKLTKLDISKLSQKKILKCKLENGRTFDYFTKEADESEQDYFIQFFSSLEKKNIKNCKLEE